MGFGLPLLANVPDGVIFSCFSGFFLEPSFVAAAVPAANSQNDASDTPISTVMAGSTDPSHKKSPL
jgi:hypothetical protein